MRAVTTILRSGGSHGVFYGWIVTAAAFVVLTVAYGVQFSFGVFFEDIKAETGWRGTDVALVYSGYIFAYSFLSRFSGTLTDRIGPRAVIAIGAVFMGVGYAATGQARSFWVFAVALAGLAAVGMSASWVPCSATVSRWFEAKRGVALGIATSGGSMGGFLAPLFAGLLAANFGWRTAYTVLGVGAGVVLLICSRIIVRDPAQLGLQPDGAVLSANEQPTATWGFTRSEAIRTPFFWVAGSVFLFTWLVVFMPVVHLVGYGAEIGFSKEAATIIISAIGLGGLFGRTATGIVSDRTGRLQALAFVLCMQITSFLMFAFVETYWILVFGGILYGCGYGGTTTMFPAVFSDRYGPAHVGAIVGIVFSVSGSFAAVGPYLASWIHEWTESYQAAFIVGGLTNTISLGLVGVLAVLARRSASLVPGRQTPGEVA